MGKLILALAGFVLLVSGYNPKSYVTANTTASA